MGIIIRQGAKASIITYLGTVLGTLNIFFFYLNYLSKEEVGLIAGALVSVPIVFNSFFNLGIPHIVNRFFPHFENKVEGHQGFFSFILLASLCSFALFFLVFYGFQEPLIQVYAKHAPLLSQYTYILPPLTLGYILIGSLEAYIRVHLRIVIPTILREIVLRLANMALVLAYGLGYLDLTSLINWICLGNFISIFVLLTYIKFLGQFHLHSPKKILENPALKSMFSYGLLVMFAGLSFTMIQHIEKLFLPAFVGGLGTTAIFDINARMAVLISIPRNLFASISNPILANAWKENNLENIKSIYYKSSLNLFIIGAFLFLLLWINLESIYHLLPSKEDYSLGKYVVLMVGISKIVDMGTGLNSEILVNSRFYKFDLFFNILLAVVLVLGNAILIPIYSFNGAAMASLVAITSYNFIKYFFLKRTFELQPLRWEHAWVALFFLLLYLIFGSWNLVLHTNIVFNELGNIALKSSLITIITAWFLVKFNISEEVNALIEQWKGKLK